jgi:hypothetical protein
MTDQQALARVTQLASAQSAARLIANVFRKPELASRLTKSESALIRAIAQGFEDRRILAVYRYALGMDEDGQ